MYSIMLCYSAQVLTLFDLILPPFESKPYESFYPPPLKPEIHNHRLEASHSHLRMVSYQAKKSRSHSSFQRNLFPLEVPIIRRFQKNQPSHLRYSFHPPFVQSEPSHYHAHPEYFQRFLTEYLPLQPHRQSVHTHPQPSPYGFFSSAFS